MGADKKDEGKPSFTVSDRRSFSDSGEPKEASTPASARPVVAESAGSSPSGPSPTTAATDPPAENADAATAPTQGDVKPVDFHTFILSLGSSALLHLGELDRPDGSESRPDLRMAKHTIDIIAMLQEKTKGNLTPPEDRLMESLIFDLRLRYVELRKKPQGG